MNWILLLAFIAMSVVEAVLFGKALATKRVRRIAFKNRYVTVREDPTAFWLNTAYHFLAAVVVAGMAYIFAQQPGLLK